MPMPRWWGKLNKRTFNSRALENGKWKILTHVGRSSGKVYRTPLDAVEVDGTYVFILVYGSGCDWAQNVLASGTATLDIGEGTVRLTSPRLITAEEAAPLLEGRANMPPRLLKIDEFLQMDILSRDRSAAPRA